MLQWLKNKLHNHRNAKAYDDYLRVEYRKDWERLHNNEIKFPSYWI